MNGKWLKAAVIAGLVIAAAITVTAFARGGRAASSDALYSDFPSNQGYDQPGVAVGRKWTLGAIPLCTTGSQPVTLTSITPVVQKGAFQLDRIAVRQVTVSTTTPVLDGVPPGLRPVTGFVIPSPSPCGWAPDSPSPYYEVLIVGERSGPVGGCIQGLRVVYRAGSAQGTYTIPIGFGLWDSNQLDSCKQT